MKKLKELPSPLAMTLAPPRLRSKSDLAGYLEGDLSAWLWALVDLADTDTPIPSMMLVDLIDILKGVGQWLRTGEFPAFEGVADGEWVENLSRVVHELASKAGQPDYRNRDGMTTEVQAESLALLSKALGACIANREREVERARDADAQAAAANGAA